MSYILVTGLLHFQTSVRVDGFPIEYSATSYRSFGISTQITGEAYQVARTLTTLGEDVRLLSFVGRDSLGEAIRATLVQEGIGSRYVLPLLDQTPQVVVFHDGAHRRQRHIDEKGVRYLVYPEDPFASASRDCSLCALTDAAGAGPLLSLVDRLDLPLALKLAESPDRWPDLVSMADILFVEGSALVGSPEQFVRGLRDQDGPDIVVVDLGAKGAMIWVRADNFIERLAAVHSGDDVVDEGSSDVLYAFFLRAYLDLGDPYDALEQALLSTSRELTSRPDHSLWEEGVRSDSVFDLPEDPP